MQCAIRFGCGMGVMFLRRGITECRGLAGLPETRWKPRTLKAVSDPGTTIDNRQAWISAARDELRGLLCCVSLWRGNLEEHKASIGHRPQRGENRIAGVKPLPHVRPSPDRIRIARLSRWLASIYLILHEPRSQ
ncbi:hypothetical protein V8C26DRAFT_46240 [Trichoderma gracile]